MRLKDKALTSKLFKKMYNIENKLKLGIPKMVLC